MSQLKEYINVFFSRGKLHVRGLDENDNRVTLSDVDFQPMVWAPLEQNTHNWKGTIVGQELNKWVDMLTSEPLVGIRFDSIRSCQDFVSGSTKYVDNGGERKTPQTKIHTTPSNSYISQYLCETFSGDHHVSSDKLRIVTYDIETEVGHRIVSHNHVVHIKKGDIERDLPICEFEYFTDRDDWDVYDPKSKNYVKYSVHPWRYIDEFPEPEKANERITLITVKDLHNSHFYTWGCWEFDQSCRDDVTYFKCRNETELLTSFLEWWKADYPDAVTGWNTAVFDNTYLSNRIAKVLGGDKAKELSPFGEIITRVVEHNEYGKSIVETNFAGISNIDYLKLYKKFTYGNRESYKLDSVASDEIGFKKVPNPTGGSFKDFYSGEFDVKTPCNEDDDIIKKLGYQRTQLRYKLAEDPSLNEQFKQLNDKVIKMCQQRFIEYNIRDVELVDKIDTKQHFIDLIMTIAYAAHCNYEDVFSPVKTWEHIVYNYLNQRNVVIPIKANNSKAEKFAGAYVKSPQVGRHEFCESFDLDSLYPHLIMEFNISPETLAKDKNGKPIIQSVNLDKLVAKEQDTSFAINNNLAMAATGVCFRRDKLGILPFLCDFFYSQRKANKRLMLNAKSKHEQVVEEMRKRGLI